MGSAVGGDLAALRGGPRVELGGSIRTLRFDFNALAAIEEKTGRNMLAPDAWNSVDARALRVYVWAALLHEDPTVTIEQVGAWITEAGLEKIRIAYLAARVASLPPMKPGSPEVSRKRNPPQRGGRKKSRPRRRG